MVANLADLGCCGEQVVQMALPARRVLALELTLGFRGVDHGLDATTNTVRCLGLGCPDRLDDPQHQCGVDAADREITDRLAIVVLRRLPVMIDAKQSHLPLRDMLRVLPAGSIRLDEPPGCRAERDGLRRLDANGGLRRALGFNGIAAIQPQPPRIACLDPSIGKAHVARRAEPMPSASALALEPEQPRLAAAFGDLEIQAAAVAIETALGQRFDLFGLELSVVSRHRDAPAYLHLYIHLGLRFVDAI